MGVTLVKFPPDIVVRRPDLSTRDHDASTCRFISDDEFLSSYVDNIQSYQLQDVNILTLDAANRTVTITCRSQQNLAALLAASVTCDERSDHGRNRVTIIDVSVSKSSAA